MCTTRNRLLIPCVPLPLIPQVLGNAAVSRGFSYFLAQLCGRPATFFNVGSSSVNPVAFGINVLITLLVATGVRESAFFITGAVGGAAALLATSTCALRCAVDSKHMLRQRAGGVRDLERVRHNLLQASLCSTC